jgi:hypothetical protein
MEMSMTRPVLIAITAALMGSAAFMTDAARGQTSPGAPQAVLEQNLVDMNELAARGEKLTKDTETAVKDFDEKQRALEATAKDLRQASRHVDDLISILRAATNRLGPNGDFLKVLREQEQFLRELAAKALSSANTADHPFGEQLMKQASELAGLSAETGDLAAKLAAQVDRVERSRSQIEYAYVIKRSGEFIATAKAYLDGARKLLEGTTGLVQKGNEIIGPVIPSQ